MYIHVLENASKLSQYVAQQMYEHLLHRPQTVLGFATGETPKDAYHYFVNYIQHTPIALNGVRTFNLDEYVGLSPDHPNSYHAYMNQYIFKPLQLSYSQTHLPHGDAFNSHHEAEQYDRLLQEHGPIDLQLLGLGVNGHIGFNEPGTSFYSRTQVVDLSSSTRQINAKQFSSNSQVPTQAITMGLSNILESKTIFLLVYGATKRQALYELLHSSPTESFPASVLHHHPNIHVFTTEETMNNT